MLKGRVAVYETPVGVPLDFEEYTSRVEEKLEESIPEELYGEIETGRTSGLFADTFYIESEHFRADFDRNRRLGYLVGKNTWAIEVRKNNSIIPDGELNPDYYLFDFLEQEYDRDTSKDNEYTKLVLEAGFELDEDVNPSLRELNELVREE